MKYYSSIVLLLFINAQVLAQVAFENIDNVKDTTFYPYDSTNNYPTLKNIRSFKGQTLLVAKVQPTYFSIHLRTRLPSNNIHPPTKKTAKKNKTQTTETYFPHPYEFSNSSNKDSLLGHYFYVQDVVKRQSSYFFKLLDKKRGATVYFKFNPTAPNPFPFLTLGFYEKEKSKIGQSFFAHKIDLTNIMTKETVTLFSEYLVIDRIVVDKTSYTYYYIIKDKKGIYYKIIGSDFDEVNKYAFKVD
ncbi:hypothetical protein [Aureispira sp. CCB-QB1]|uniref:hypothetical protein n=1 Tax=Aureispira sp. CCB-QB1 TaxID=1313421 RepID=UPI000697EA2F|nr:hypothetical protein [Aureispira sp. CCB-QB1]